MTLRDYEQVEREAFRAAVDRPADEAARVRLEAAARIPRFPSLLHLHGDLLSPVVEHGERPDDPALTAEALRRMLHVARASGADGLVLRVAGEIETLDGSDAFTGWLSALARASRALREEGPDAALPLWEEAQARLEAVGREELAVDQGFARFDIARRADDLPAALQALEPVAAALEGRDAAWDGERHELHLARALVLMQRDAPAEAAEEAEASRALADAHGLTTDVGQDVTSLVPVLLHLGRRDEARALLDDVLERVEAEDGPGPLEMALRHLDVKTHEVAGDLGGAITAGFQAIRRTGEKGTLENYVAFTSHVATLYLQARAYLDCYHMIDTAERTLGKRQDGAAHAQVFTDLKEALRSDLGDARYRRLVAEHDQIERDR